MKVIKPSVELIVPKRGHELEIIERAGRTCYKSEDKIKEGSAKTFISGLINRGHESVLEHGRLIYVIGKPEILYVEKVLEAINKLSLEPPYVRLTRRTDKKSGVVSANVRAWRNFFKLSLFYNIIDIPESMYENILMKHKDVFFDILENDLIGKFNCSNFSTFCNDTFTYADYYERWIHDYFSAIFICDTGVSHEIVRHRPASYSQESSRYCNYSLGKFGKELTFIEPSFFKDDSNKYNMWYSAMSIAETNYMALIDMKAKPEEARSVLPKSIKTELMMTTNFEEWRHFFLLRAARLTGPAHPQMEELARMLLRKVCNEYPGMFADILEKVVDLEERKPIHG